MQFAIIQSKIGNWQSKIGGTILDDTTESQSRARIIAYLENHNTLTLATEREGKPFACSLFYVNDGWTIYFVSDTKTRHAQNIAANPRVAATVHEDYRDWRVIQGAQLEGECAQANVIESAKALVLYAQKFPFVKDLGAAMAKVHFYKITPHWVRFVDNTRGFGFKEEIEL
ncbi:MAG: pyridoxamine 5'-phosphate oxidase family protein [Chloroflexi bacterium]|nr:pyridoxamine 5'-phosphate oxidase family protein [Chloroflexota bacterium]